MTLGHKVVDMVQHDEVIRADEWSSADLEALAVELAPAHTDGVFGVVVQDSSAGIVAATPAAEKIMRLTAAQMSGRTSMDPRWMTVDENLRPLPGDRHPAMLAAASRRPVRDVVMGVHRPGADGVGKHVWLSVTALPIHPAAAGPQLILCVFSVLTGPRATALRLAEAEASFRFIAENSTDMVAWQRFDSTFLWVSPASAALLGRCPAELVGTRSIDIVHPDDQGLILDAQAALEAGTVQASTVRRMLHADGHYVWVETTVRLAASEAASAAQIQTSSRNVDDRVAAQLAQAEAEARRDRAVRLFRTAMEHAAIGMAIRGLDGSIVEMNGALGAMLGRSAAEMKGSNLRDFTHHEDIGAAGEARDVLLSGRAAHDSERRYLRSDGAVLWVHATSVLLPKEEGEPQLVLTQMQDITARKDAIEELTRLAATDALTGLSNRVALIDRLTDGLAVARRAGPDVGVVYLDLDGFKAVNDELGHDVGDELLRQVARRISAAIRGCDTAARIGGDEFVILCERIRDLSQVRDVADRIADTLKECFALGEHHVSISASIGVSLGGGVSAGEALRQADEAMYRAKRRGRGLVDVGR